MVGVTEKIWRISLKKTNGDCNKARAHKQQQQEGKEQSCNEWIE